MMRTLLLGSFLLLLTSCIKPDASPTPYETAPLVSYVDPFIGTGGHGHTYPGATAPFGMMQLSPDTRLDGWDGCSGYHYSDSYIYGFSHTHLSGTGVSDYGDVLLMPTNEINFHNGADGKKGYRAHFSHQNEQAAPGYYEVLLDSTNINVALTVQKRAGMHRYMFPSSENQVVILDLEHRDKLLDGSIEKRSDTEISGHRFSEAWASDQRLYYYIKFSHPFTETLYSPKSTSEVTKAAFQFNNPNNDPIIVSVGISAVDEAGARKNHDAEIGTKNFQQLKKEVTESWEDQLSKIRVVSPDREKKTNFYTALYHTMIAPNVYQDVDGRYRGMDLEIHQTTNFEYYTVFSLWDTYRAAHPLYTLIEQKRTNDFIKTLLAKYDEGGILPMWDLSANYTGCMIGYHSVSVIADAYLKGIRNYDTEKAFAAMKHSATRNKLGLKAYREMGYVPVEEESESVSKTLEYAYDDWTIAQMATAMGKTTDAAQFYKRAQSYKNIYNPETGFMQGRFRNTWFAPFDAFEVNFNYTEANAWQYSVYVPQDISGLMTLMGGKQQLRQHLDKLFNEKSETSGRDQADITGLIGQYAHGNEPSHHMAYLYNFVNTPSQTQKRVHQILTTLYKSKPDGISGNEDCGQMSAWYVFSAMGFYPVTPGSNEYIIGTPLFDEVRIPMPSENASEKTYFTITANNLSDTNFYIQSVTLNGSPLQRTYLKHDEILKGGTLHFEMGDTASTWGTAEGTEPKTEILEPLTVPVPFITKGDIAFKNKTEVQVGLSNSDSEIFYSLNNDAFKIYTTPIKITENSKLTLYAADGYGRESARSSTQFYKIDPNRTITLDTEFANEYSGGGNNALIDGISGANDFRTGAWQGYQNTDVKATVDLGDLTSVTEIEVHFLQDQKSWIFYPTEVLCYVSEDNKNFTMIGSQRIDAGNPSEAIEIKNITFSPPSKKTRYIKIEAKNFGEVPEWHLGAPYNGKAWVFIDEIEFK